MSNLRFFVLLFYLVAISYQAFCSNHFIVTRDLNIRSGPASSYESLGILANGDTVLMLDSNSLNWVKIKSGNLEGYSSTKFLKKITIDKVEKVAVIDKSHNPSNILIIISLLLIGIFTLIKKGEKLRSKTIASILALFFGSLGLQKFYLGHINRGIYSIFFSWTLIPSFVGLADFLKLSGMKKADFNNIYNNSTPEESDIPISTKNPSKSVVESSLKTHTTKYEASNSSNNYEELLDRYDWLDNSSFSSKEKIEEDIIDVNEELLDLSIEVEMEPELEPEIEKNKVPAWEHTYVYSSKELNNATKQQQAFYWNFKKRFLNGEKVDILGNTNYAFVLYFDLLSEYPKHKNFNLMAKQFELLGEICPKTKIYSADSLKRLNLENTRKNDLKKLEITGKVIDRKEITYPEYNLDWWKLGDIYKDELKLDENSVEILNKFYTSTNTFTAIEKCRRAVVQYFLVIINNLESQFNSNNASLERNLNILKKEVKVLHAERYFTEWSYIGIRQMKKRIESEVYLTIYKRVENSVRTAYGHKRKVSQVFPYPDTNLNKRFEEHFGKTVEILLLKFQKQIVQPDESTAVILNTNNVNRWRNEYEVLKDAFLENDKDLFVAGIERLERLNKENPKIENIFFESSKFIAKYDKTQALMFYVKYIYYDLRSDKFSHKPFIKSVQKILFSDQEEFERFDNIIQILIKHGGIQYALNQTSNFYVKKRRQIKLNKSEIQDVKEKHVGTVELLNHFLDGPAEVEKIKVEKKNPIISKTSKKSSFFKSTISFSKIQELLLIEFKENNYELPQEIVEVMAVKNGMFKNQLIDGINELCSDYLEGEVLIEEDDEKYIIEESYYNILMA